MLIEDFVISKLNSFEAVVSWTSANVTDVSWIYSDGGLARGPLYLETLERKMTIPFVENVTKAIEVHDFLTGSTVTPTIEIMPNITPTITWKSVQDAARYKVFHTPFGGSEELIYNRLAEEDKLDYLIVLRTDLPVGWNFFRVESVDEFGNESVRSNWNFLVFDLPAPADDLAIVDGSGAGLFDIAIT